MAVTVLMYHKTRICKDCNEIIVYNSRDSYSKANKHNSSCNPCGNIKIGKTLTGRKLSKETRLKMSESKSGANHPRYGKNGKNTPGWKGGDMHVYGYNSVYQVDQKYKYEHRIIFEKYLGRELLDTEVVHHEDEIRDNNDITNLILFNTQSDHRKWHGGNKKVEHIKGKDLK